MKVFKSKIDLWLVAIVFAPFLFVSFKLYKEGNWQELSILIVIVLMTAYIFNGVRYIIDDEVLVVKIGIIPAGKIKISDISKIEKSWNPLSAPALSLKRLEITHATGKMLISPKDREEFVKEILKSNPKVQVVL